MHVAVGDYLCASDDNAASIQQQHQSRDCAVSTFETNTSTSVQEELLRIAQEAMSNAVRHAQPTVINVSLRYDHQNSFLKLQTTDQESLILRRRAETVSD